MERQITGLHAADRSATDQIPDGIFLVKVQRAKFQGQAQKPYYTLALDVFEPSRFVGPVLPGRPSPGLCAACHKNVHRSA